MSELPIDQIILGDCLEVMRDWPDGCVDAVVTDPPYPKKYDEVWDILGQQGGRVLKEGGFLVSLCGHYQVPRVIDALRAGGLQWWWACIVTNNNQPIMHGFKAKCCHKPCVVFRKGKARPQRIFYDNFALRVKTKDWQKSQGLHKWGQAESMFFEPIEAFSAKGDIILDPFVGAASIPLAAWRLGRHFIGIEKEAKYVEIARRRVKEAQNTLFAGAAI